MPSIGSELAALYHRDLTRLIQQFEVWPEDGTLWLRIATVNSAGNLALHLEGNLREYIGRQIGGVAYERQRPLEFSSTGVSRLELISRLEDTRKLVVTVLENLAPEKWDEIYPENVLRKPLTVRMFVMALYGHLNYHLGQVDTTRRGLTGGGAIDYAGL